MFIKTKIEMTKKNALISLRQKILELQTYLKIILENRVVIATLFIKTKTIQ